MAQQMPEIQAERPIQNPKKAVAYRRIADSHCAKAYGGEDAIAEAVAVSSESDDRRRTKKAKNSKYGEFHRMKFKKKAPNTPLDMPELFCNFTRLKLKATRFHLEMH